MSRRDYGSGTIAERRPGRWLITIESGRDPQTGKRERRRFSVSGTRRDAQKALREALRQRDTGTRAGPDKITLGEWLTAWLARHQAEGHIAPKSHDRYRVIIQRHLIPALGRLRLQDLRPDHIGDMQARWLSGQTSTASQALSGATVHKRLVVPRRALAEAVRSGIIIRDPPTWSGR